MQYIKKIQQLLLALVFMCVSGGALAWLWVAVDQSGDELMNRIQTIENQRVFENQLNELRKIVENTEEQRESLYAFIIKNENDTIRLLSELDEMALKQDVELATRQLKVIEGPGNFDNLEVSFSVSGIEGTVLQVIKMFETLPYHGTITSLSFERTTDVSGVQLANASISLLLTISNYD